MTFSTSDPLYVDHESSTPFSFDIVIQEVTKLQLEREIEVIRISDLEVIRRYVLEFPPQERPLWLAIKGYRIPVVSATVTDRIVTTDLNLPLTILAYEQRIVNGTIAWLAAAQGISQGQKMAINLVFLPDANGKLQMAILTQFTATEDLSTKVS